MLMNANAFWIWVIVAVLAADVIHTLANRRVILNVKRKSDTTWEYIYRRATLRALRRGFVTMNSPLVVKPELARAYEPIKPELVSICQKARAKHATDPDIALEIENQHFPWIADNVCRVFGMDHGECLVIAVEVGKAGLPKNSSVPEHKTGPR